MKLKIYLLSVMLFTLVISCEKSETSFVETESNLKIDIAVKTEIVGNSESVVTILEIEYPFSGENTYSVNKISNTESGVYNIQKIKPHLEPILTIHGITDDVKFKSIFLEWGYKSSENEDFIMQEPIDLSSFENEIIDGIYKIKLESSLIQLINSINEPDDILVLIKIRGDSDFNFNNNASLEIPVIIEATALSPRFELF